MVAVKSPLNSTGPTLTGSADNAFSTSMASNFNAPAPSGNFSVVSADKRTLSSGSAAASGPSFPKTSTGIDSAPLGASRMTIAARRSNATR